MKKKKSNKIFKPLPTAHKKTVIGTYIFVYWSNCNHWSEEAPVGALYLNKQSELSRNKQINAKITVEVLS